MDGAPLVLFRSKRVSLTQTPAVRLIVVVWFVCV